MKTDTTERPKTVYAAQCLLLVFKESRDQLIRKTFAWGMVLAMTFRNITGILVGNLIHGEPIELERGRRLLQGETING